MVEQPAWLLFKERGVGMDKDCLLLLDCAVAAPSEPCCVVKITRSDGLRSRQGDPVRHHSEAFPLPSELRFLEN